MNVLRAHSCADAVCARCGGAAAFDSTPVEDDTASLDSILLRRLHHPRASCPETLGGLEKPLLDLGQARREYTLP